MAVVAGVAAHIRRAEDLMSDAHAELDRLNRVRTQQSDQMLTDLQSITAVSTLATAHIAMANFLQMRNDS